jgi:hypothetical protein
MISAQQARLKSQISSIVLEDEIYNTLINKFNNLLRTSCLRGEYSMIVPATKSEANNERFVQTLVSKGYEVDAQDFSYTVSWQ